MLLVGLWHAGLSDQGVEDMANVNLHVMCFLDLSLEDDVPDHAVLLRFRTKLTQAQAWDGLLAAINRQIEGRNLMVKSGCHVDGSITHGPGSRKPNRPTKVLVRWQTLAFPGLGQSPSLAYPVGSRLQSETATKALC
jgi:IS5 family transposase